MSPGWDYLIVTAASDEQAKAYWEQLGIHGDLGLISGVGNILVVADPDGRRIGSGGRSILCLLEVYNHELRKQGKKPAATRAVFPPKAPAARYSFPCPENPTALWG